MYLCNYVLIELERWIKNSFERHICYLIPYLQYYIITYIHYYLIT